MKVLVFMLNQRDLLMLTVHPPLPICSIPSKVKIDESVMLTVFDGHRYGRQVITEIWDICGIVDQNHGVENM